MANQRVSSIDQFRGAAILAMVLGSCLIGVKVIPAWLKRSEDIGLTFGLSFAKQVGLNGARNTDINFFKRYPAILGAGALMGGGRLLQRCSTQG